MKKFSLLLLLFPGILISQGVFGDKITFHSADDAVVFGLQNSRAIRLGRQGALEGMKIAQFSVKDFLPSLSFSISETDSTSETSADSRSRNFTASLTQLVFDGGKSKLNYDMNRIMSLYSFREYESSLRNYSSEIILQYYNLLKQQSLIAIKEDLFSIAMIQLALVRKEAELGLTLETDLLEYEIYCVQIEQDRDQVVRDLQKLIRLFKSSLEISPAMHVVIEDNALRDFDPPYYEPHIDSLWAIIKSKSIDLQKQDLQLEFSRRQFDYSRRWFIPSLSVQGSMSFSGDSYPLTEPKYSVKVMIDFGNSALFPVSLSGGYGFERNRLYNVNNSSNVPVQSDPAYNARQNLSGVQLLQNAARRIKAEGELKEALIEAVVSHDNLLRSAAALEKTLGLLGRRLEFTRHEVALGEKKHIDYLKELSALTETRIKLLEYQVQAAALARNLEIMAAQPFGGLENVYQEK